jgi:hypothetical protein
MLAPLSKYLWGNTSFASVIDDCTAILMSNLDKEFIPLIVDLKSNSLPIAAANRIEAANALAST